MGVSYPPLLLVKKYSIFGVPVWEPGITSNYGMVLQESCAFGTASCLHACLQHFLWFPPSGKEPMRMSFFFFSCLILVITFGRDHEACTRYRQTSQTCSPFRSVSSFRSVQLLPGPRVVVYDVAGLYLAACGMCSERNVGVPQLHS